MGIGDIGRRRFLAGTIGAYAAGRTVRQTLRAQTGAADTLQSLIPADRAVLTALGERMPETLQALVDASGWRALDVRGRAGVVAVLRAGEMIPAPSASPGDALPAIVAVGDVVTLLESPRSARVFEHLAGIATEPRHPALTSVAGFDPLPVLLRNVVAGLADPNDIHQGNAPSCADTSLQRAASNLRPVEMARIARELTGPAGESRLLRGAVLRLPRATWKPAEDGRGFWDYLFQTAGLQLVHGKAPEVVPDQGMNALQSSWLERELLDDAYEPWVLAGSGTKESGLGWEALRKYGAHLPGRLPVFLAFGPPPPNASAPEAVQVGHMVQALGFATEGSERLLFWNPQNLLRHSGAFSGQSIAGWRMENASKGIFSIDRAEFDRQVMLMDVPKAFPVPENANGRFSDMLRRLDRLRQQTLELLQRLRASQDGFESNLRA